MNYKRAAYYSQHGVQSENRFGVSKLTRLAAILFWVLDFFDCDLFRKYRALLFRHVILVAWYILLSVGVCAFLVVIDVHTYHAVVCSHF